MSLCHLKGCDSTAASSAGVCDLCWRERISQRQALPELWLRLQGLLPKGSQAATEPLSRPAPGPSLPLQICVLDTLRQIPLELTIQASTALTLRGLNPITTAGKRWQYLLAHAINVLEATDEVFYGQPQMLDYVQTITFLHRKALSLTGLDAKVVHLPMPCPSCHCQSLYRHIGRRQIVCTRSPTLCGATWTETRFADLVVEAVTKPA